MYKHRARTHSSGSMGPRLRGDDIENNCDVLGCPYFPRFGVLRRTGLVRAAFDGGFTGALC